MVDTALVGRLDTQMLAALAVATTILSSVTWVFNFLIHASTQAVASAGPTEIGARARVSLSVALAIGCAVALLLFFFRHPFYSLVADDAVAPALIDTYFIARVIGHPFAILFMTSLSLLRGLGRVKIALVFVALSTGLNVLLSWLFLYVYDFGLSGAAWGTVLANFIGFAACTFTVIQDPRIKSSFSQLPPLAQWFSFGKNAINLFGRSVALTGSLFVGARFAAGEGAVALASHQILLQVWLFVSFFIDGVAITANIKGAQLSRLGERANFQAMVEQVLLLGLCLGSFFCLFYFLFEDFTQNIFTSDGAVTARLSALWPWLALSQIPNALAFIYDGILFGLGAFGGFVWVRRWMIIGALTVFLPLVLTSPGLEGVWAGLIGLNLFRLLTGWWSTRHILQRIADEA